MAVHKQSGKKFAIKHIDRSICPSELLVKEVDIMKRLNGCPGIIHLVDVYEEPDHPKTHLVLELVTGGELFDYIVKSTSYSEKSASDYIRQLCETVEYLHSKNVVHRDLKPENLLFEDPSAQTLKLCDFGLADTLKDEFDFLTLAVGTKSYMAPEVTSNLGYGKPVDMYSVGVILYILLCGYLPIDPDNGIFVLEFPPSEWSEISYSVKLLIKQLLDESPAARPTATQVLKHPWVRGTNASTKPLVGTLRNLQNFTSTRIVAPKKRGDVMALFGNPPPIAAPSANGNTASGGSPRKSPKVPPSPQKTKKSGLKVPAGVIVPAKSSGSKKTSPSSTKSDPSSPSTSNGSKSPTVEKHSSTEKASTSTSSSPTPNKKRTGSSKRSPGARPKSKEFKEPIVVTSSSNGTASASPSIAVSTTATTTQETNKQAGGSAEASTKPSVQVSDRTKKFLAEQEQRDREKKEAFEKKKARRQSAGVRSRRDEINGVSASPEVSLSKDDSKAFTVDIKPLDKSEMKEIEKQEKKKRKEQEKKEKEELKELGKLAKKAKKATEDLASLDTTRERSNTTSELPSKPESGKTKKEKKEKKKDKEKKEEKEKEKHKSKEKLPKEDKGEDKVMDSAGLPLSDLPTKSRKRSNTTSQLSADSPSTGIPPVPVVATASITSTSTNSTNDITKTNSHVRMGSNLGNSPSKSSNSPTSPSSADYYPHRNPNRKSTQQALTPVPQTPTTPSSSSPSTGRKSTSKKQAPNDSKPKITNPVATLDSSSSDLSISASKKTKASNHIALEDSTTDSEVSETTALTGTMKL